MSSQNSTHSAAVVKADKAVLKKKAYELRLKGWSYADIGAEIGVSSSTVPKYVAAYGESISSADELQILRSEHISKYQFIVKEYWGQIGSDQSAAYLVMNAMKNIEKLVGAQEAIKIHHQLEGSIGHAHSVDLTRSDEEELAAIMKDLAARKEEDLYDDAIEGEIID